MAQGQDVEGLEHLSKVTAQGVLSTDVTVRLSLSEHKRDSTEDGLAGQRQVHHNYQVGTQGCIRGLAERGLLGDAWLR